jgi:uncharacterized protein YjbJ (UPF0337 family)
VKLSPPAPVLSAHRRNSPADGKTTKNISSDQPYTEAIRMDKDRIDGALKQAKGAVKEVAGKVTGSTSTEMEGKAEKTAGKAQSAVGKAKDDVRDSTSKL